MAGRRTKPDYDGKTPLPDARQELFCTLFSSNTLPHFFGHGQNAYAFAYGYREKINAYEVVIAGPAKNRKGKPIIWYESEIKRLMHIAAVCAARLLIKADIKARTGNMLDELAKDHIVDRELVYLIQQRRDLASKLGAVAHYDKRMQRIREKLEVKHEFAPIIGFTFERPAEEGKKKK